MKCSSLLRVGAIGVVAASTLLMQTGSAEAASCTWSESTYSVTFTCHADTTSFAVCLGSAQFAAYRGTPVTKNTNSFGGHATLSGGSLYLVRGSEHCSANT